MSVFVGPGPGPQEPGSSSAENNAIPGVPVLSVKIFGKCDCPCLYPQ